MNIGKGQVLLFKALTEDDHEDSFKKRLDEAGLRSHNISVLDFDYCNLNLLEDNLRNPELFSGLIFTSPRAIIAVSNLEDRSTLLARWKNHPVFVVGNGTLKILQRELGLDGQGSNAGNASSLADIIIQSKYEHPFLFPCGNLKRDELSTKLISEGIGVVSITVYCSKVHQELEKRLEDLCLKEAIFPEIVVYFSPSGIKHTFPILHRLEVPLDQLKFIAIGPTTEAALLEYKLKVWSVASKPTPEHLLEAIEK